MAIPDLLRDAVAAKRSGSVVAPAGHGKTETIANIVAEADNRCLLLTHTLAGVEALRRRLKDKSVPSSRYQLDTIAAISLRYAQSFPVISGHRRSSRPRGDEWPAVYQAAGALLTSGLIDAVLQGSYRLVLVDEYQDCTLTQHAFISGLAQLVPTIVFGDPLQRIFGFRGDRCVDWESEVFPEFPAICELETAWRWKKKNNEPLAEWLRQVRSTLLAGQEIDFNTAPDCIRVFHVTDPALSQKLEAHAVLAAKPRLDNRLIIIGSKAGEARRAAVAKRLQAQNIEKVDCEVLYKTCAKLGETEGVPRLQCVMDFLEKCLVGTKKKELLRRVAKGRKRGTATPAEIAATRIVESQSLSPILDLLECMRKDNRSFRGELLFAMRDVLKSCMLQEFPSLEEAAWHTQERRRHAGREHGFKAVGSTLLVKGLEFDRSVIIINEPMTREDFYVAITRASVGIGIVTPHLTFSAQ